MGGAARIARAAQIIGNLPGQAVCVNAALLASLARLVGKEALVASLLRLVDKEALLAALVRLAIRRD
jgi:hypothetical protein